MTITKIYYDNGAVQRITGNGRIYTGFPDCPICKGNGFRTYKDSITTEILPCNRCTVEFNPVGQYQKEMVKISNGLSALEYDCKKAGLSVDEDYLYSRHPAVIRYMDMKEKLANWKEPVEIRREVVMPKTETS